MRVHFFQVLLCVALFLSAQSVAAQQRYDSANVFVHLYPLQAADYMSNRPMLTIGAECRFLTNWAIGAGGGLKLYDSGAQDTLWVKPYGYSLHAELKRYLVKVGRRLRLFASLEYRWIIDGSNDVVNYYDSREVIPGSSDFPWYRDAFSVERRIQVANTKFGCLFLIGNHLYGEAYAGLGMRWREVIVEHIEFESNPYAEQDWHEHWPAGEDRPSDYEPLTPNLALGVKFGYRF